ncbi:uncharacterized protein LOC125828389 [Solanum verrucosum]|uniref:uncharacterized protein LOC125828389 n=1 Tax=Solanum verrucosum TaxID=315347 RepID=UPI0020CFF6FD|nr:uncharacterized protein LOC125828389 [Solanum verrucosum]
MADTTSKIGAMNIASSSRTSGAPAISSAEKPGKFTGMDFKMWQQKMLFCLTTLYKDSSKNVFLKKKYKTEDAGLKKFIGAKFLDFKMVDSKSVVTQVQELQMIINDILAEGLDFKKYLKHKIKKMYLEDLIVRLRTEANNKAAEEWSHGNSTILEANIVEDKKGKLCTSKVAYYKAPKETKNKYQANVVEFEDDDLCAMLFKCNIGGNLREWWIDFGVTRHVCTNKELFASYEPTQGDDMIYMENLATAKVEETSNVLLKMTFGKVVTLKNVLHVPELRKNLASTPLLTKN